MSNFFVGLMFGIGFGGWVYYQMMRRSGGNSKNSWIMAILAAAVGFFVIYSIFGTFFKQQ